ncbi:MAG: HTTM domain-containing protein [Sandaracinaceae bacterium]
MKALELAVRRAFAVPVAAVRPYLVFKLTLLLLAFDLWITRVSHAGRYGAGGFNVAHWPWLDWVQPEISPPMYIGACVFTAALCFAIVFADRPPRWLIGLAFLVHTWSWAMSMLDSYQHHYLLSIVLFCMIFFPPMSAEEALRLDASKPDEPDPATEKPTENASAPKASAKTARSGKKRKKKAPLVEGEAKATPPRKGSALTGPWPSVSAWSYVLLSGSAAIVYAYTAFSKTDPEWLSGASLRQVIHYPPPDVVPGETANVVVRGFHAIIEALGDDGPLFWFLMGHSVVLVQIVISSGYLLAPFRDVTRSLGTRIFYWVALFTALSFHFGAELMGLEIGWFSYYMIAYALIMFLPVELLVPIARAVLWPKGERYGLEGVVVRAGVALETGALGWWLDEPILLGASVLIAAGSFVRFFTRATWTTSLEKLPEAAPLATSAIAALLLAAVGWAADLPGAREAAILGAVLLGAGVVAALVRNGHARALHGYAIGTLLGALALAVSIQASDMRWDYWRNVGGDHRRRGEIEEAYVAYVKANRYAPPDDDRRDEEQQMRRILEQRGVLPREGE